MEHGKGFTVKARRKIREVNHKRRKRHKRGSHSAGQQNMEGDGFKKRGRVLSTNGHEWPRIDTNKKRGVTTKEHEKEEEILTEFTE
jgi:hypothetical protein